MLIPVFVFLAALMIVSRHVKGPIWALCIAWMISIAPIASGAITYRYLVDFNYRCSISLILFIGAYAAGAGVYELARQQNPHSVRPGAGRKTEIDFARSFQTVLPIARILWWVSIFATALNYIDFTLFGGAGLDDLAALRDQFANKTSASAYAQIGSILTWACLFCYMFALFFRKELSRWQFVRFLIPVVGFFLLSVFSAGRQAAFQILVVTLLLIIVTRIVRGPGPQRVRKSLFTRERLGLAAVTVAMSAYMGYVAVARNDGGISDDKSKVLQVVFEFQFSDFVERITQSMGTGLRGAIVEAVIYFSSPPALFDNFLTIKWPDLYYGAQTFPFLFRQVQSITGISVIGGLVAKMDGINATGVIGAGWATAMSSYIIDFGYVGSVVFLFISGVYSAYAWRKAIDFSSFYYVVIGVLVLLNVIYMPLIPGATDTNILILWFFCIFMHNEPYRHILPYTRARSL